MASYQDIQNNVAALLNRNTATTAQIQAWIQNGIQRIQRELRCPAMEKTVTVTFNPANPFTGIIIPNDFIELINIFNRYGKRLTKEDATRVKYLMQWPGIPAYYYRQGGLWLIGPAPITADPNEQMALVYYGELAPLVNPTDTNTLSVIAADLIEYAALSYAGDFFTDTRAPGWEQRYTQIRDDLQVMADEDESSGGSTVSPVWYWPSDDAAYGWTTGGSWSE